MPQRRGGFPGNTQPMSRAPCARQNRSNQGARHSAPLASTRLDCREGQKRRAPAASTQRAQSRVSNEMLHLCVVLRPSAVLANVIPTELIRMISDVRERPRIDTNFTLQSQARPQFVILYESKILVEASHFVQQGKFRNYRWHCDLGINAKQCLDYRAFERNPTLRSAVI